MNDVMTDLDEVLDQIAHAMYVKFHEQAADMWQETLPYQYSPWGHDSIVTDFWHQVAASALTALKGEPSPGEACSCQGEACTGDRASCQAFGPEPAGDEAAIDRLHRAAGQP